MTFLSILLVLLSAASAIAPIYGKSENFLRWYRRIELALALVGFGGLLISQVIYWIDLSSKEPEASAYAVENFRDVTLALLGTTLLLLLILSLAILLSPNSFRFVKIFFPVPATALTLFVTSFLSRLTEGIELFPVNRAAWVSGLFAALLYHFAFFLAFKQKKTPLPKEKK